MLPITITTADNDVSMFKELGVTECNWQLLEEDVHDLSKALKKIKSLGLKVISLHSPFIYPWKPLNIELYHYQSLQRDTLYAAEDICEHLGYSLPIVYHSTVSEDSMELIDAVGTSLSRDMISCPYVTILIENAQTTPPADVPANIILKNTVEVARRLSNATGRRVGNCFDICHAEILCTVSRVYYESRLNNFTPIDMEQCMKEFSDSCGLVHVAHALGTGLLPTQHGRGFQRSYRLLETYLGLLRKYFPKATYVLEISEDDYSNRVNALATCKILQDMKG